VQPWERRWLGSKSVADEHSEPGGMKVLRLYADALGESRFETTTMPMALKEFAPPAAPLRVSTSSWRLALNGEGQYHTRHQPE
jgi:hypothetical protein